MNQKRIKLKFEDWENLVVGVGKWALPEKCVLPSLFVSILGKYIQQKGNCNGNFCNKQSA